MSSGNHEKINVGITGQAGFIGTHLFNYLALFENKYNIIPFEDKLFEKKNELTGFIKKCDCIVHLAAVNRHHAPEFILDTNINLTEKLICAMESAGSKAHIIISSSIQENRNNIYGRSKKECRKKLSSWSKNNGSGFTGLIIPNVFGPFGRPFYNSVISTFSYQLVNGETPEIEIDAGLELIYVGELIQLFEQIISSRLGKHDEYYKVNHTYQISVGDILKLLQLYKSLYLRYGIIPPLNNTFDVNLFNTFRSYIDYSKFFPFNYLVNKDDRGIFVETIRMSTGGQVSFSTTHPGITRGNHFHTRKIERFAVLRGDALVCLRKIGNGCVININLSGCNPSFVDIPVWHTHNITNIGDEELFTIFWVNEFFDPADPDTFYEPV